MELESALDGKLIVTIIAMLVLLFLTVSKVFSFGASTYVASTKKIQRVGDGLAQ